MLDEVPIVSGNVSVDKALTRTTVEALTLLNVKGEEAVDPMDGAEAAWVPVEAVDALEGESWDAVGYMIRHIEALLMANLPSLSGHQEVTNRLTDDWSDSAQAILDDPAKVTLLTRLIKGLLAERVPTTAFSALCEMVDRTPDEESGLDRLLVRARMLPEIRAVLQGNDPNTLLLTLAPELQKLLRNAVKEQGDVHALCLPPEETQETLTAVRNKVGNVPGSRPLALVVEDSLLRRYVRLLVALEFPHLSAISHAELEDGWQDRVAANVELE
jgi:flagellar biosynthesis component FlhA